MRQKQKYIYRQKFANNRMPLMLYLKDEKIIEL